MRLEDGMAQCEHGVSFAPGLPAAGGRSIWCGECFDFDGDTWAAMVPIECKREEGTATYGWADPDDR